jgi:hypothetical protein
MDLLGTEFVDAIIRRYQARPGCRFIDIIPVGIPIHVVRLLTVFSENQQIPPIDEFVLKSLAAGVNTVEHITGFLGLHQKTVESVLVSMHLNELISVPPQTSSVESPRYDQATDRGTLLLTAKGRLVLESLSRTTIVEKKIEGVAIHGFTGQPAPIDPGSLISQSELKQYGMLELPAIPRECPRPDLINVQLLQQCVSTVTPQLKRAQTGSVVGVRAVLKPKRLRYQPAYMLQFESTGLRKQGRYVFVGLNGEQDLTTESAFNEKKGPSRIVHLLPTIPDTNTPPQAIAREFLSEKQFAEIPLSGLKEQAELKAKIQSLETALPEQGSLVPVSSRTAELREKNAALEQELQHLRAKLEECPYQMLATYECSKILRDAMATASRRLMIVSAFLSDKIVNDKFIETLQGCLNRGVEVWVGFGFDDKVKRGRFDWSYAEDALKELRRKNKKSMVLHDFKNSHEKLLIKDDEYVVVGSYNWLSFEQERWGSYRRENALLVRDRRLISEQWEEYTKVMRPEAKTGE